MTNPQGSWRLPRTYRLLYAENGKWQPVEVKLPDPQADVLQTFAFPAVTTQSLRLEVTPDTNSIAGVLEWMVK